MDWGSLKNVVAKGAPLLGGLLGGPVGGAAGSLIATALGVEPTPEKVGAELKSNPQAATLLLRIENEHTEEIMKLKNQEMELMLLDKQSARVEHKDSKTPPLLTLAIMLVMIAIGIGLFFVDIPEKNRDMVNMFVGAIIGYASSMMAFWFGADEQQRRSKK